PAYLEGRRGAPEALGIVVQNFFVLRDGQIVVCLGVGELAEIELGVGGKVGVTVILEVVLEFGAGQIVFAAGDVAEAVGIERVGGGRAAGNGGGVGGSNGRSGGSGGARGWCGRRGAGDLAIEALDGILQIYELLVEFAEAGLDFLEIVRQALDLRGHGVESYAGISLDIPNGFLERAHGGAELCNVVVGLL